MKVSSIVALGNAITNSRAPKRQKMLMLGLWSDIRDVMFRALARKWFTK